MPAYAVIGGQWGDEGKGKVIDYLAGEVDSVVRYAGGNNAGHTVVNEQGEFQLHLVPSGICWPDVDGIIGNGVVVDPDVLLGEMEMLQKRGIDTGKLHVSERAHVIMPYHVMLDALEEQARGSGAIGTTGRGIGPAYVDKTGRDGIRVGDLLDWDSLAPKLKAVLERKNQVITKIYDGEALSLDDVKEQVPPLGGTATPLRPPHRADCAGPPGRRETGVAGRRAGYAAGPRSRLVSVRHIIVAVHRGCLHWPRSKSPSHKRGLRACSKPIPPGLAAAPCPPRWTKPPPRGYARLPRNTGLPPGGRGASAGLTAWPPSTANWSTASPDLVLTRLDILDGFESVKICVGYRADGQEVSRFPANTSLLVSLRAGVRRTAWLGRTDGQRHQVVSASRQCCDLRPPH